MNSIKIIELDKENVINEAKAVEIAQKLVSFLDVAAPQTWHSSQEEEIIQTYGSFDNKILFDYQQTRATAELLRQLNEKYPENEEIVGKLAKALEDLPIKEEFLPESEFESDTIKLVIEELRSLNKKYPNNIPVVESLMFLIDMLASTLTGEESDKVFSEYEELEEKYADYLDDNF